jgi:hypothetical protein
LLELLDGVESACESIDGVWCDWVAQYGGEELERFGSLLARASEITEGDASDEAVVIVSELLECLEEYENVALQAVFALQKALRGAGTDAAIVDAFEMLRVLSPQHQATVSSKEVLAAELVMSYFVPESGAAIGCQLRESGCMALFALGCRNGVALCGTMEFVSVTNAIKQTGLESVVRLVKVESSDSDVLDELAATCAASMCGSNLSLEAIYKLPAAGRGTLEKKLLAETTHHVGLSKLYTDVQICRLLSLIMEHRLFDGADLSLACGLCIVIYAKWYMHMDVIPTAIEMGVFDAMWDLHLRVCPEPLPAAWWSETSAVVDIKSVQLACSWMVHSQVKKMPSTLMEASVLPSSWWGPALAACLRMITINASARLSAAEMMQPWPFVFSAQIVEAAARLESQHALLLEPETVAALEFAATHEFLSLGLSLAAAAAGALVEILGRREGGKTLGQQTVFAVLETLKNYFHDGHVASHRPLTVLALTFDRVATMAISDANKGLMLQFGELLDTLIKALLLGSPRRGEGGADAAQEASAGLLANLALFGPGAAALRVHDGVMRALRLLRDGVSSTEASRQSAVQALFQLEERKQVQPSSGVSAKHVMMSYNWDHQPLIKRIHAALMQRGYNMWIDVEQMKGSTVDAMSLAVEDAEVVLIGVSRAYKESTNCRLEAQYAMQREVDIVPLMLVDG